MKIADSTKVSSIDYDPGCRILEVGFQSGDIYQYFDVPARVYNMFKRAPAKRAFLNYYTEKKFHFVKANELAA